MTLLRTAFAGPTGEQVWLPTYAFLVVGTLLVVLAVWAAPRTGVAGPPADSDLPVDGKDAG
jgi:hypothetical protein